MLDKGFEKVAHITCLLKPFLPKKIQTDTKNGHISKVSPVKPPFCLQVGALVVITKYK